MDNHDVCAQRIRQLEKTADELDDALADAEMRLEEKDELISHLTAELHRMVADRTFNVVSMEDEVA